jgi:CubicO group peptidase (beta-lactamase class C family)
MKIKICFVLLIISTTLNAQTNKLIARLDSVAQHIQWAYDIPAFSVTVSQGSKTIWSSSKGNLNNSTSDAVTASTDFHQASVSKPFAATAILQLVEQGLLHLDTPLVRYLPAFTMKDERYLMITLEQILSHRSGIPDVGDYAWDRPDNSDSAGLHYLDHIAQLSLDFAPGSNFNYSNTAFNLLAAVIQTVTGQTFDDYCKQHIFLPAGMTESSFMLRDIPVRRRALPHTIGNRLTMDTIAIYPYNRIHAPSSTLHSNVNDMAKWVKLWVNKGVSGNNQIIKAATWQQMLQVRHPVTDQLSVCLSWFTSVVAGRSIYAHSGGDPGFRTYAGFDPVSGYGVVLMGNNDLFDGFTAGLIFFKALLTPDSLQLPRKSIALLLKTDIFNKSFAAVRQRYYTEKKKQPERYDFGGGEVISLANWLYGAGHRTQAIDVIKFCIELEPSDFKWYEILGDVYTDMGDKMSGEKWYCEAWKRATDKTTLKEKATKDCQ